MAKSWAGAGDVSRGASSSRGRRDGLSTDGGDQRRMLSDLLQTKGSQRLYLQSLNSSWKYAAKNSHAYVCFSSFFPRISVELCVCVCVCCMRNNERASTSAAMFFFNHTFASSFISVVQWGLHHCSCILLGIRTDSPHDPLHLYMLFLVGPVRQSDLLVLISEPTTRHLWQTIVKGKLLFSRDLC